MARADASASIQVVGLKETIRSLEQFGVSAEDLKTAFGKIGLIVVQDAQVLVPTESGALAASIKASKTKNKSTVRAGGARTLYAGVQEYGWPAHNIEPSSYLRGAVEQNQGNATRLIDDELGDLIRKYDLK